ncbi:hypothetical protein C7B79_28455 [Chroococcidiopsis cubana CCALA 043]|uniref:hypothetical protein n=1 Tax=Chroococcidiopsis cubana TaxID=171392 RepID=UPI000D0804E8|nr:hypothetical protein [Chroococcidiopsis cubana]PSB59714.1 hypothetical protein C7B79_28455 [Chroococcidiopsis cubana CCALA 043]
MTEDRFSEISHIWAKSNKLLQFCDRSEKLLVTRCLLLDLYTWAYCLVVLLTNQLELLYFDSVILRFDFTRRYSDYLVVTTSVVENLPQSRTIVLKWCMYLPRSLTAPFSTL